jgi:hypothetical protein
MLLAQVTKRRILGLMNDECEQGTNWSWPISRSHNSPYGPEENQENLSIASGQTGLPPNVSQNCQQLE